jgi:hypothetical protein
MMRNNNWLRVALVAPFVLACYAFGWGAWRDAVCTTFVALSHVLGLPVQRVTPDTFLCLGHMYRFAIACTALDAFFGSIPLVWMERRSVLRNLLFLATYFGVLSGVNLARLAGGVWLYVRGTPWWLTHDVFAGVFYFGLFLWIAQRRGWGRAGGRAGQPSGIQGALAG